MEYVLYAMAALGVHNLWMYQKIMVWPKKQLRRLTKYVLFIDEAITCPPCFMLWCLLAMVYAGPFIPDGIIYALAAYPLALFYLSFRTAFLNITKKSELFLDSKNGARKIAEHKNVEGNVEPISGNLYKTVGNAKIVRAESPAAPPKDSMGPRLDANGEECGECEKAKKEREAIVGK